LEEEILGHSLSDIHYDLEEESSKSIECVLEETKIYYEYQFVSRKDVLHLSKWLGSPINSDPFHNSAIGKGFDSFLHRFGFNNALVTENKPVKKCEKVGRNQPCPCGSGKKYKKCCGQ
jgi:preprotein translocase subunit SecA